LFSGPPPLYIFLYLSYELFLTLSCITITWVIIQFSIPQFIILGDFSIFLSIMILILIIILCSMSLMLWSYPVESLLHTSLAYVLPNGSSRY
jgi:hypothetical protein